MKGEQSSAALWIRRVAQLYRLCLIAFPKAFRDRYGKELVRAWHDESRYAYRLRGWNGMATAWLRMFTELALNGPRERWHHGFQRRRVGTRSGLGIGGIVRTLLQDIRYGFRSLRRAPAFAAAAIVTLGLGIGANTAIFSVVNGVVLRPLPYGDPDGLMWMSMAFRGQDGQVREFVASEPEYIELREAVSVTEDVAGFWTGRVNLGGVDDPQRVTAAVVTANLLNILRVAPALGRGFVPGEDRPGADKVIMLADGLWRRSFGGDPDVVGRSVLVRGLPATVIGVLPPSFSFPGGEVELLRLTVIDPQNLAGRSSHYISMIGRLSDGATIESARGEITTLVARWTSEFPNRHGPSENHPIVARSLHERVVGDVRPTLLMLSGAVAIVLLIASANVANLMLVRSEDRHREIGIRNALGASRGRLISQVLTESSVIALLGGVVGVGLAVLGVRFLVLAGPADLPRLSQVGIDGVVLAFTAVVALASGLIFGMIPALVAARSDVMTTIKEGNASSAGGNTRLPMRRLLVVGEVGLAVVLVVGAGLLIKSFNKLLRVDPGFSPDGVVTMDFSLNAATYPQQVDVARFHAELVERVEGLPGVTAAGAIRSLPLRGPASPESLTLLNRVRVEGEDWIAQFQLASPGYFSALAIPLLNGRGFSTTDRAGSLPVVIVNETMAKTYWLNGDALGKQIKMGPVSGNTNPDMTIIGVVGDVRQTGLGEGPVPRIFVPRQQGGAIYGGLATRQATFVVRSTTDPIATMTRVRALIKSMDPNLPLANVQTMDNVVTRSLSDQRFLGLVMGVFSVIALVLGAVGIYGLMAYTVARRTREIGLRIALGADHRRVLGLVVKQGMVLTLVGVVGGLGVALVASRVVAGLVFEVSVRDPVVFTAAPLALLTVALLAAYLPARRAAAVDPMEAMRTE